MKFKNGREIIQGDAVTGIDWRGGVVTGTVITGDRDKGHPELVFQHGHHKTACPSLDLAHFLHSDDARDVKTPADFHQAVEVALSKPAAPTGAA